MGVRLSTVFMTFLQYGLLSRPEQTVWMLATGLFESHAGMKAFLGVRALFSAFLIPYFLELWKVVDNGLLAFIASVSYRQNGYVVYHLD